jgi:hypothetical protein
MTMRDFPWGKGRVGRVGRGMYLTDRRGLEGRREEGRGRRGRAVAYLHISDSDTASSQVFLGKEKDGAKYRFRSVLAHRSWGMGRTSWLRRDWLDWQAT